MKDNPVAVLQQWLVLVPDAAHWCQHYPRVGCKFCLVGGLVEIADYVEHAREALVDTIRELYPDRGCDKTTSGLVYGASTFNDHPDTTYTDVRRVVETTIARLTA